MDNPAYTHLTGWEILGTAEEMKATVLTGGSVSSKNPHYLALDVRMEGRGAGIRNRGYHDGIVFDGGNSYRFSCWAKREQDREAPLSVSLQDENGKVLDKKEIILSKDWKKYEAVFTPETGTKAGSLTLIPEGRGRVYLDFVLLFPVDTYRNRPTGCGVGWQSFWKRCIRNSCVSREGVWYTTAHWIRREMPSTVGKIRLAR